MSKRRPGQSLADPLRVAFRRIRQELGGRPRCKEKVKVQAYERRCPKARPTIPFERPPKHTPVRSIALKPTWLKRADRKRRAIWTMAGEWNDYAAEVEDRGAKAANVAILARGDGSRVATVEVPVGGRWTTARALAARALWSYAWKRYHAAGGRPPPAAAARPKQRIVTPARRGANAQRELERLQAKAAAQGKVIKFTPDGRGAWIEDDDIPF